MQPKRKIMIDCDPGVDDALALAFAAANRDLLDILCITTVGGNQTIEKVTRNALDLAEFYGLDVPVARGMAGPLVKPPVTAGEIHGETGLGYCVLPKSGRTPVEEDAVSYLYRRLTELPKGEKVTLVPTGPLTNIALLLKLYPQVKEKIVEIVFMGGAARGGNVTAAAEFNIYEDPEAAKIVFGSGVPLVMCGLDVTWDCTLTRKQVMKLCQSGNPVAKACGDMVGFYLESTENKYRGMASIHDVVPFMYLMHPEIFKIERTILDVDCSDGVSRGSTICDLRWWLHDEEEMNSFVLMEADADRFQEYLITALYELGETVRKKR